jgi:L-seryl-tRNA(Ser) seleniumtransferase
MKRGGDLIAFSAKYFGGPNAGGFVMGRADLISIVSSIHFTEYEDGHLKFGRPLKMDRQTVVAVVVALEDWLSADHDARLRRYRRLATELKTKLHGAPGVVLRPMFFENYERFVPEPVNCLVIEFDESKPAKAASEVAKALEAGDPSIIVVRDGNRLAVVMDVITDHELSVIAERLLELINPSPLPGYC